MAAAATIHRLLSELPREETYGLRAQLARAAVSLPANIAEGQARHGTRECLHFPGDARGSLAELEALTMLRLSFGFPSEGAAQCALNHCEEVSQLLIGLARALRR
ncbi:MAG: four helix bundle protein [Anaerolineae bacterium]|nr:four helix bundle protein [Anaerolineae bacterium]